MLSYPFCHPSHSRALSCQAPSAVAESEAKDEEPQPEEVEGDDWQ